MKKGGDELLESSHSHAVSLGGESLWNQRQRSLDIMTGVDTIEVTVNGGATSIMSRSKSFTVTGRELRGSRLENISSAIGTRPQLQHFLQPLMYMSSPEPTLFTVPRPWAWGR